MSRWLLRLDTWLRERHPARSTVLFCLATLPWLGMLWVFQAYALWDPEVRVLFDPARLRLVHTVLGLLILWLSLLGGLAWVRRGRPGGCGPVLGHLVVTPTLLMVITLWLLYGLLDTPLGLMVMALLIVARALFALRFVLPGLVLGTGLMLVWATLQAQDLIGASPLLAAPVFTGSGLSWWWALWLRVVFNASAWPFAAALLYLFSSLGRHRAELEALVRTDRQTGLCNRREFMNRLGLESHRHERSGQAMSLIMIDLDHFKRINDTHGHPAGDVVLAHVGALIRAALRQHVDVAARMGGEEFAVLLPDTDLAGADRVARKLGAALRMANFSFDGQPLTVTLSAGVAQARGGQGDRALRVADANLYKAKQAGRNQVVSSLV